MGDRMGVFLWGNFLKEVSPHPFKNFCRLFYSTHERNLSWRFLFSYSALGASQSALQTLLDFSLLYADGAFAPASVLGPTTTKRSRKLVAQSM